jgi:hypothetical protein
VRIVCELFCAWRMADDFSRNLDRLFPLVLFEVLFHYLCLELKSPTRKVLGYLRRDSISMGSIFFLDGEWYVFVMIILSVWIVKDSAFWELDGS